MTTQKVAPDVLQVIHRAADLYGQWSGECFGQEMHNNCLERGMESPIEHLFWVACHAICGPQFVAVNPEPEFDEKGTCRMGYGLFILPQRRIGKFRVDFLLEFNGNPANPMPKVVVELDGHDFHDKDKSQRSYEKARDRYLTREGYVVLHFTGSDVVKDPFRCAHEALSFMPSVMGRGEYNPADPLCQGL